MLGEGPLSIVNIPLKYEAPSKRATVDWHCLFDQMLTRMAKT